MSKGGGSTSIVEISEAVSKFSRLAGDLVRDIIVGFGSIISAVSYIISAGAPISRVMKFASGVTERLEPVMANVLVSFIAIGATTSNGASSFASSTFGPLGEFIGILLGHSILFVFQASGSLINLFVTFVVPLAIKIFTAIIAAAAASGAAAA
jgi:hypothetical protein